MNAKASASPANRTPRANMRKRERRRATPEAWPMSSRRARDRRQGTRRLSKVRPFRGIELFLDHLSLKLGHFDVVRPQRSCGLFERSD
jgi:hypothetical protein